jgi:hypothetical protein
MSRPKPPKRRSESQRPRGRGDSYQVFVSHATADKWIAKTLCEKLEEIGATTFRDDRDINGGDDIPEEIRLQIKRSRELVVLLTPKSINRQWVTLEIGAAWGWSKNLRIVVVLYHVDVDPISTAEVSRGGDAPAPGKQRGARSRPSPDQPASLETVDASPCPTRI